MPDPAVAVAVPPHVLPRPLGVATATPLGKPSVNATPCSATVFAAGLVMVKVSVDVPLIGMPLGLKALAITGGATTLMLAEAVPPVPPSVEVMAALTLFCVPAAVPVTLIEKVQNPLAAMLDPDKLITFVPWVAVIVPVQPLGVFTNPFGVEITRPAGKVSLNPIPDNGTVLLLLLIVKVKLVEPFRGMLAAPNCFWNAGGPTTVIVSVAAVPAPPSVEFTVTELLFTPAVVPCTSTLTVHDAVAAKVPPERLAEPAPATGLNVPPHVLLPLGVGATTSPAGKVSVNPIPVSITFVLGFVMLMVSVVVPFNGI